MMIDVWLEMAWNGLTLGLSWMEGEEKKQSCKGFYRWRNMVATGPQCSLDDVSSQAKFCSLEVLDRFCKSVKDEIS